MTNTASEGSEGKVISAADGNCQPYAKWVELVECIRRNEKAGMEELYSVLSKGVRYYLVRQVGVQEAEDQIHECFMHVVNAIQRGALREPERLMGYVRTIVHRQVAQHIDWQIQKRREQTVDAPHLALLKDPRNTPGDSQGRQDLARRVLNELGEKDQEILRRFYLYNQNEEQICAAMQLTSTQFRLLKSSAKARFGELGQKNITGPTRLRQVIKVRSAIA